MRGELTEEGEAYWGRYMAYRGQGYFEKVSEESLQQDRL